MTNRIQDPASEAIVRFWMMRKGEGNANTQLIAAAPELLEALQRCVHIMENGGTWTLEDQTKANQAIAKATGAGDDQTDNQDK